MLVTEEQAKTMACWRTLCADTWSNPKDNEGECHTATSPCIGSACMAWRWACGPRNYTHAAESERRKYPPNGRGYCGLAGRPEE